MFVYVYTIALVAQKGGTGQATLAINLAVAAEAVGHRAVLIDLDPQASAAGCIILGRISVYLYKCTRSHL